MSVASSSQAGTSKGKRPVSSTATRTATNAIRRMPSTATSAHAVGREMPTARIGRRCPRIEQAEPSAGPGDLTGVVGTVRFEAPQILETEQITHRVGERGRPRRAARPVGQ